MMFFFTLARNALRDGHRSLDSRQSEAVWTGPLLG